MPGHYKKVKRPRDYTRARIVFETREKNIHFHHAVRRAQDRANLRMERDRLTGLLHTNVNPGLTRRISEAKGDISRILGD